MRLGEGGCAGESLGRAGRGRTKRVEEQEGGSGSQEREKEGRREGDGAKIRTLITGTKETFNQEPEH